MSNLSSSLQLQVPRRKVFTVAGEVVVDPYDSPQPQTATCCTALQRGVASDGLAQPRYAPVRMPPVAPAAADDDDDGEDDDDSSNGKNKDDNTIATMRIGSSNSSSIRNNKKAVRKCKSTVDELKASQVIQGPRLRRSVGMRRDWSFEDLGNAA